MTLPREVTLVTTPEGPRLSQRVVPQIDEHLDTVQAQTRTAIAVDGPTDLDLAGEVVKLEIVLRPGDADRSGISVFSDGDSGTLIGYDTERGRLFVDRRNSGNVSFHPTFASIDDAPVAIDGDGTVSFEVYLDRASVEVFAGGGLTTLTDQVFPDAGATAITAWSEGGQARIESITAIPLAEYASRLDVSVEATPKMRGGKVHLSVSAANNSGTKVDVTVSTPYGDKTIKNVKPGTSVTLSINTKTASVPAGQATVTVTGTIEGDEITETKTALYSTHPAAS